MLNAGRRFVEGLGQNNNKERTKSFEQEVVVDSIISNTEEISSNTEEISSNTEEIASNTEEIASNLGEPAQPCFKCSSSESLMDSVFDYFFNLD
jgi:methyl-accepting chemotaxis protein